MKADTVTKNYLSDPVIFADVFNCYVYGGKRVISPENLKERDTAKTALPFGLDGAAMAIQKLRDVQKLCVSKTDGKFEYILFGIESQTNVHLAMPVRNNFYDALDYIEQVESLAKSHRRNGNKDRKPDNDEFLSGFWKTDRLIPTITLTIYFSADAWDGPLSLLEMMGDMPAETRSLVNDYKIHLMAPAQMTDEEISKLDSSMREVMLFIKYSKNDESLEKLLQTDGKRFKDLERRAIDVIEAITKSGMKYNEKEEVINVCDAIRQMREKSERIGEENAKKSATANLYEMGMNIEKISQALNEPVDIIKKWLNIK